MQELLTTEWTRKARWIGVNNFVGPHRVQTFFMPMWLLMISWIMGNSSARRRIEICRSRITIRSTTSMFSSAVIVDERPILCASSKPCSRSLNSVTYLATVRYDGAESLQTFCNSLLISMAFNPFLVKNLMTGRCSMFDIFEEWRHIVLKTFFFSYEGNESIGPKLVYLNKNAFSIEWQKSNVWEIVA